MDGGEEQNGYTSKLTTVTEGEWAGWSFYPGGDPYEDLAGPFYYRIDERGPVCAFRAEHKHMNGGMFLHGGCVMTFADFCPRTVTASLQHSTGSSWVQRTSATWWNAGARW